ncbi:UdgX family uracil-DNA binding protein [Mongoliimonas terrestris]|uniref:UdgX family uracil-DNA binding protein n=1 Tax=Mongoliimonas terrestris TaxID=1709001 RepID=UPI000949654D|nr:UdgX family uracil-DNA binding protein [Mongoliimonas terrestris]
MIAVDLAGDTDFAGFRNTARRLAAHGVKPADVVWRTGRETGDLFGSTEALPPPTVAETEVKVPRAFVPLAEAVICHSAPERLSLLYQILYRFRIEPKLLEIASDPDVTAARRMEKAVGRDVHKMHAFVRFRELATPEGPHFIAFFEPEHFIEERASGFFVRRFAPMRWSVLTPRLSLHWDLESLTVGPGARREDAPSEDATEDLWRTYFSHIFNPARLKVKAMTAEMPKKYWRNLPEATVIGDLIAGAEARVAAMIAAAPTAPPAHHERLQARGGDRMAAGIVGPQAIDEIGQTAGIGLAGIRAEADGCRRCALWAGATQTVFGEGPERAEVVFVGEQPGDREDLAGRPFVGPAGQVFDEAIEEAGIDRTLAYVTNAVKHFKNEPRGKRRIHKKPNGAEIEACRWWLAQELTVIKPKLIVGLGGTALQSLLDRPVKITEIRGKFMDFDDGPSVFATVHPSYLLRLPDPEMKARERQRFVDDLKLVAERIRAMG